MDEKELSLPENGEISGDNVSSGFAESFDDNQPADAEKIVHDGEGDNQQEQSSSDNFGELPEFAKRRIGEVNKKYQRTEKKLQQAEQELNKYREMMQGYTQQQPQYNYQDAQYQQQDNNLVYDAYSGQYVDKNSPQGQAILVYQQQRAADEARLIQSKQESARMEFERSKSQLMDNFESSLEEAYQKHQDFTDVVGSAKDYLTPDMAELAMMAPNPGEFLYYLAGNQKEVQRLSKLPPLQMAKELNRHMVAMEKRNLVSKAPEPIQGVGQERSSGGSFNNLSYEKMKAASRERARKWANKG